MKVCLLIGFQYGGIEELTTEDQKAIFNEHHIDLRKLFLPGICIDLYHAYHFCHQMEPDRILVITDIVEDPPTTDTKEAIMKEIVAEEVLNFINNIKMKGHYYQYTNIIQLKEKMKEIISGSTEFFFYYTGHAKNNYMILPDNVLHSQEIKKLFYQLTSPTSQICLLFDCCFGLNLDLPFKLVDKRFNLVLNQSFHFPSQNIICIYSSNDNENSGLTIMGSIFTRIIFKLLHAQYRSITTLIYEINRQAKNLLSLNSKICLSQTSNAYSSHPDIYCLFPWIFHKDVSKISIDPLKNILTIIPMNQPIICYPILTKK